MRPCFIVVLTLVVAPVALAEEKGKTHTFDKADKLPKTITAKVGDTIVIREEVKPGDVEEFSVKSDNKDVKLESKIQNGRVHVVIKCPQKAEAKVGWKIETKTGAVVGYKDLGIKIE